MEIDRLNEEYIPTPDEKRLYGLSSDRIPFADGHLLVDRFNVLQNNLNFALSAPYDEYLGKCGYRSRQKHLARELAVARGVMDAIALEASATELIEGIEAHLRTYDGS